MPSLQLVHALPQPCQTMGSTGVCSEFWYPAGPEMNSEIGAITTSSGEYGCVLSAPPCLEFPDSPASPAVVSTCTTSPSLYITAPIGGNQYCYPVPWARIINAPNAGLPNYFTWLNAWSATPTVAGTFRQGFVQAARSVNPYIASTVWDTYIDGNVYDSLYTANPLSPTQLINWMTIKTFQLSNSSLTYQAPAHTLTTYRFVLRPDLYFQDGKRATAYDVAFSYLSMVGSGAFLGRGASTMTGITILGPSQFDIAVDSLGFTTLPNLTGVSIVPARYWTNAGSSAWDAAVVSCTTFSPCPPVQYNLSGPTVNCGPTFSCASFSTSLMTINPADMAPTFDPIVSHTFVGSGPWECGIVTSIGSGICSSSGTQSPPLGGSYTLTRFGCSSAVTCLAPAASTTGSYFRSSGDTALWIWSGMNGDTTHDFLVFAQAVACFGKPFPTPSCSHWQQGIGNLGTGIVSINQIAVEARFFGVNWVAPFDWQTNPPTGIAPFPPVLYEGSVTLNPCSIDPVNGYDC
jgi:extracellular solute-binding protein (family 5)